MQEQMKPVKTVKTHVTGHKRQPEPTHHIWVVRRSDSLVVKIIPVDGRKKVVILYF